MANRIFNIIGWIGTALVVVALGVRANLIPNLDPVWATRLALAGLVCMVLYMASQWRDIAAMFSGRQARYGALTGVSLIIAIGVLVAVNYIGARRNWRKDFTANQQYSLSDQTRNVLQKLDGPLTFQVFATDFQPFRERLKEYEYVSNQVSAEYVDIDRQRVLAQQNDIQQNGTILIKYKGRTERVTQNTEQDITNGVIKAVSGEERKVYFTQGHDEKDPTSSEADGLSSLGDALKRENYAVEKLVLAQTGEVPADASVVVVAGPKTDFFPPELDALKKYLDKQGKVLLLLDPPAKPDSPQPTSLIELAKEWGIEVGDNVVVDISGMGRLIGTDASVPVAANYPSHPITERFAVITAYPLARSVAPIQGGTSGRSAQTFIESSPRSWAESDVKGLLAGTEVALDEGKGDRPGPISMAAAVSVPAPSTEPAKPEEADTPKPEARVAVVGDSDFGTNGVLGIQGNRDMFMNIVGWLSQQENLISIRPREASDRRITLTETQQSWITLLVLLVIPGGVFGAGILSWWRRR
ncbi:MAG: GldG family protein [Vicinamibacterales bacterium]